MWGIISVSDFLTLAGAVLTLTVLEGLLSADNALVLAVMVRHLPKHQQKRALRYGIWGAFVFRFIAVIFAASLLQYWQLKVLGGTYLLYLAGSRLATGEHAPSTKQTTHIGSGFWATVLGVELADIAFSIDSILAAVAMADGLPARLGNQSFWILSVKYWVVYVGGVLGIITMRFVAGLFLILLKRFSGLAIGAYFLVAWIGLELVGSGFHVALSLPSDAAAPTQGWRALLPGWMFNLPLQMPEWFFWTGMLVILVASLLYQPRHSAPVEPHVEAGETGETREAKERID
jgi:YkoY family integral membrane protein